MQNSDKFTIMKNLSTDSLFSEYIPPFVSVNKEDVNKFLDGNSCCILRSALKSEGRLKSLLPGKSISIQDIHNESEYNEAIKRILSQNEVAEIILQQQIRYQHHFTVYYEKDFFYLTHNAKQTIITPQTIVGAIPSQKSVISFFEKWNKHFSNSQMILELGITDNAISLFQAVQVSQELISSIITDDLIQKTLTIRENWKKSRSLWGLLKMEWNAFRFRKEVTAPSIAIAFQNWQYIFHYFYLFCRIKQKPGSDHDFALFLSQASNKKWPGPIIKKHLAMANETQKGESLQLPASFISAGNSPYFIGKGEHQGKISQSVALISNPTPEQIYQLSPNIILFTTSKDILGHAILAAAERGIPVVANLDQTYFNSINANDHFYLNFDTNQFVIRSK